VKLATFEAEGEPRLGVVDAGRGLVVELPGFGSMVELIAGGDSALHRAQDLERRAETVHELATVRLLAPLMPNSMRDCLVFEEHTRNASVALAKIAGREPAPTPSVWYQQPIYYKGNRCSVIGHEQDVIWPSYSKVMDYELELACIIGREGTDIPREEALQAVFGYTVFNDASARDAQSLEMPGGLGPAKGKDFDTGNVLGPWIVTADELGDPQRLTMVARVNDEEWSRGNSADMHHPFDRIIEFVSRSETLYPGDVIGSGTVATGSGLELGRFLSSGDVVELEIERIGTLRNRFVAKG
jgi:2-keto-4-pentenoate hydratase/2-oxohepta-3-ene-1,7-dioic acid hydratase in catechol pathway